MKPKPATPTAAQRVEAVFEDIRLTRRTDQINNFWRTLARDPGQLERVWGSVKAALGPGPLNELTKELIYLAVSVTNGCSYCIASHASSAQRKGMTAAQFTELLGVVGVANETNRLAIGYAVPADPVFTANLRALTAPPEHPPRKVRRRQPRKT